MCRDFDATSAERCDFKFFSHSAERIIFNGILNDFVLLKTLKLSKHGSFKLEGRRERKKKPKKRG